MKPISRRVSSLPLSAALNVDLLAKKLAAEGKSIINFCVGEPDFDTPEMICDAGCTAIREGKTRYTNACGMPELRRAAAALLERRHGLHYAENEVAITTGGKYAVYAAVCALTDPGDEVLLPAPYWTSYYHIITLAGATPVVIPTEAENGWKIRPCDISKYETPRTKAVILNNPNNPSGAVYSRGELEKLAEAFREYDLYVIADEIYDCIVFNGEPFVSAAAVNADMRERTVLINGVSKAYAMTGWRIGYAAGDRKIISAISAMLSHTTGCPNSIAQEAALRAMTGDDSAAMRMSECYRRRRDVLAEGLGNLPGLRFSVPQGAFYLMLCTVGEIARRYPDGSSLSVALLEKAGVATVPCEDYGIANAVRISFSVSDEELTEGIRRIRTFAEETVQDR